MKGLLLARDIKSFWATSYGKEYYSEVLKLPNLIRERFGFLSPLFYILIPFWAIFKSPKFDLVIAHEPRMGFVYGFLKRVFKIGKPILVFQIILPESKNFLGRIKFIFEKFSLGGISACVVNSSFEKKLYEKYFSFKNKFIFLPLHVEPEDIFRYREKEENFIFTGGGAERDFQTLFSVAREIPNKFILVTFAKSMLPKENPPRNISISLKMDLEEFLRIMAQAKVVVIPLNKVNKSAGQVMLLQAMALGKPVIISNNPSIKDYVKDQKDCFLVEPEDKDSLKLAFLKVLEDKNLRKTLGENARKKIQSQFSMKEYNLKLKNILADYKMHE